TRDSVSCGSDHPDGASGGRVALTLRRAAVGDRCSGAQSQPLRRPVHRPHRWPDLSRPPRRIDAGAIRSVALVEPTGALCPLPLNELALLTAARPRATKRSLDPRDHTAPSPPASIRRANLIGCGGPVAAFGHHPAPRARLHLVEPRHVHLKPG